MSDNTWKRFNDMHVTPEEEENVMKEAFGGYRNTSAYCLVYLADNVVQEELKTMVSRATPCASTDVLVERQHYAALIPPKLVEFAAVDNNNFYAQIEAFKFSTLLDYGIKCYKAKYDALERIMQNKSHKKISRKLDSFAMFLKYQPHAEKLLKWYLLDVSLKETGCCERLRDLNNEDKLAIIQNKLILMEKSYSIRHVKLSSSEMEELDMLLAQYMESYPIMIYYKFTMYAFISNQWKDACFGIKRILFVRLINFTYNNMGFRWKI